MNRLQMIEKIGPLAGTYKNKLLPSIVLAQMILEAFRGDMLTALADAPNYNLFGIKGTGPAGSVQLPTWEIVNGQKVTTYANFRKYNNWNDSVKDHAALLTTAKRYAPIIGVKDPDKVADLLYKCGYSTNPAYGDILKKLIKQYNLMRFDC